MNLHRRLFGLLDAARTNYLWRPSSTRGVVWALESWARERPDDPFLSFEERSFSIGAFNAAANRYAATYRRHHDLKRDDVVALILRNRPAYLWHVYGLFKLGAIPALINPELRDTSLIHALAESAPRFIVCEGDLVATLTKAIAAIAAPIPHLEGILVDTESDRDAPKDAEKTDSERPEAAAITRGDRPTSARIPIPRTRPFKVDETRDNARDDARDDARSRDIPLAATAAYVFTSGTTGLPKAAIVKHHRLYRAGRIFGDILATRRDDGLYICLPLFHANAQVIGVPLAILHRTRLILARRFSAQRFFADCAAHHATLAIYIGEICRYLLNTPPGPQDRTHGIRAILGNGLAPNLWRPLRTRFGIQQIAEFYAATEGNAETVNILGIPGSCGSLIVGKMALVRYDMATQKIIRDRRGFACRTRPHEAGLLLGTISSKNAFDGYTNEIATSRKVLRDVFVRGDAWFDTGDILRRDRLYNLYFVDRLGDTFRWKGETVATDEVAQVLARHPRIQACAVYGVAVPGHEGRCGMAALVLTPHDRSGDAPKTGLLDGANLYAFVNQTLPAAARPRFLRVVDALDLTATYKPKKIDFQSEGFDLARVGEDRVYVRDPHAQSYIRLDPKRRNALLTGHWPL